MALVIDAPLTESIPLQSDAQGVVRVAGTRVTLDTVITAFKLGASAEEIVLEFPALRLSDIYATIAYYLNHRDTVDRYLQARETEADRVQARIEGAYDRREIRERLVARRAQQTPDA